MSFNSNNDNNTSSFSPGQLVGRSSPSLCAEFLALRKKAPLQNLQQKSSPPLRVYPRAASSPQPGPVVLREAPHAILTNSINAKTQVRRAACRNPPSGPRCCVHVASVSGESRSVLIVFTARPPPPPPPRAAGPHTATERCRRIKEKHPKLSLDRTDTNTDTDTCTVRAASDSRHVSSWTPREETAEHMRSLEVLGGTAKEKWMFLFFFN